MVPTLLQLALGSAAIVSCTRLGRPNAARCVGGPSYLLDLDRKGCTCMQGVPGHEDQARLVGAGRIHLAPRSPKSVGGATWPTCPGALQRTV